MPRKPRKINHNRLMTDLENARRSLADQIKNDSVVSQVLRTLEDDLGAGFSHDAAFFLETTIGTKPPAVYAHYPDILTMYKQNTEEVDVHSEEYSDLTHKTACNATPIIRGRIIQLAQGLGLKPFRKEFKRNDHFMLGFGYNLDDYIIGEQK